MELLEKSVARNNLSTVLTLMIFSESLSFFGYLASLVPVVLESDINFDFEWQTSRPKASCLAYNTAINRFTIVINDSYAAQSKTGEDIIFSIIKELCHLMHLHPWKGAGLDSTTWYTVSEMETCKYISTTIYSGLNYDQPDGNNDTLNESYLTYYSLSLISNEVFNEAYGDLWNNNRSIDSYKKLLLDWQQPDYEAALKTFVIPKNPPSNPSHLYSIPDLKNLSLEQKYDLYKSIMPSSPESKQYLGIGPGSSPSWSQITESVSESAAISEIEGLIESSQSMSNSRAEYINNLISGLKKKDAKWSKVIPQWIGREFHSVKEENWGKMNNILPDLLPGSEKTPRVKIGFILDVSGSMNDSMVKEAAQELVALSAKGFEVSYIQLSNEPVENLLHQKITPNSFKKGFIRTKTGGTDMNPGFQYFHFNYPVDYIICCTDGYIPDIHPKLTKKRSLMLISGEGKKPKPYKNGIIFQLPKQTSKS
jgi:hypothetical protein